MKKTLYFIILLLISSQTFAQYPTLLKDINTVGGTQLPKLYCNLNNIIYFAHEDDVHGRELWRTDGTAAGTYMVKDINVGFAGSFNNYYVEMVAFNSLLYFTAYTANQGMEIWKSDGTESGTVLIKDIAYGGQGSEPRHLTDCGDYLMFAAKESTTSGQELWSTDGTTAGTIKRTNMATTSPSNAINEIVYTPVLFGGNIFFTVNSNATASNNGIWRTSYYCFLGCTPLSTPAVISGTASATQLLYAINSIDLFFKNSTFGLSKYNLNTSTLTQLNTFPLNSTGNISKLVALNNVIYFSGYDATNGWELWKSDGTVAGTVFLKNINNSPTISNSNINNFQVCNNELYFSANNGVVGTELWKTNGTAAGTVLVSDIVSGIYSSNPFNFRVDGTKLYFLTKPSDINDSKYQVRVFDASNAQFTLLKDFTPIPYIEDYFDVTLLNQTLIFTGYDATHGFEVWKSDGTVAGTTMVKDVSQGSSSPFGFLSVGTNTFFIAYDDAKNTFKPFVSNGTTAGTFKLADINAFFSYGYNYEQVFTNVNGTVFFGAYTASNGYEVWKTDGTVAGTVLLKDINPGANNAFPDNFYNANGTLFFSATDGVNGYELWKSDGTAAGTVMVKDLTPGIGDSDLSNFIYMNGFVYFTINTNDLWRTDGTALGTTLVQSFSSPLDSTPFMVFNNKLYFVAKDGTNGAELWSLDGTTGVASLFKDINVGINDSKPQNLTTNGVFSKFYFTADNGINGRELWVSDGTAAGTILINICPEIIATPLGSSPQSLTFVGNLLLFSAYQFNYLGNKYGRELWRSGGTVASTTLVKDINPTVNIDGISSDTYGRFPTMGGYIYFPANDGTNGIELWKSNGVAASTTMVNDLFEGSGNDGLYPNASMHANSTTGRTFFEATNGQNGRELWSFQFCPTTLNINTTVQTQNQKQQAGSVLVSSSNIANTNLIHYDLTVQYQAGNVIDLQPGFFVKAGNIPLSVPNPMTFFRADIGGCN
jgi:trimeric autotransporter adhesin